MRTVTRGLLLILAFAVLTMGVWGAKQKDQNRGLVAHPGS